MCGISGILSNSPVLENRKTLDKLNIMLTSQTKRGPDSSGVYSDGYAYLAHNRLSIIDLNSTGSQPIEYGDWVMVFNGEIYNYLELKLTLIQRGHSFNGTSDTEVLIHLISEFGVTDALSKITGMFAICVYNKITREYYLVRDRLGEKPLFYFIDDSGVLFFASNPAAIVKALPEIEWTLDRECLWEYFVMGGIISDRTLFSKIKRLDSATVLSSISGKISITRYWMPFFHKPITTDSMKNAIRTAVQRRTMSDVPIALFLSGGVDSSAVAAIIKNIDAIHLISPEVDKAKQVAELFSMPLKIVEPQNFDISSILSEYANFSGEPTLSGFIPYVTSKETSVNYKVALTANGADELFFGYIRIPTPYIPDSFFDKRYSANRINVNQKALTPDQQKFNIFRHPKNFTVPILDGTKTEDDLSILIESCVPPLSSDFPSSSKYRWLELSTYVKGDLNATLDFASMANSLEVRSPFLDHTLVEMALSLDERPHISHKNGRKHFLKEILHDEKVPSSIWERDKVGFSLISSYLESISTLYSAAIANLEEEGYLKVHCAHQYADRDFLYLRSAALGFYYWKKEWIDTSIVKK